MKCWAIQKLLPLCIGEIGPTFLQNQINKHVEECSACKEVYHQYLISQEALRSLEKDPVPPTLFDGYWEEIAARIKAEQPLVVLQKSFGLFRPALMFTLVLLVASFVVAVKWKPLQQMLLADPTINRSKSTEKPKDATSSKLFVTIPDLFPHSESFLLNQPAPDTLIEYDLEQVKPLNAKDASF